MCCLSPTRISCFLCVPNSEPSLEQCLYQLSETARRNRSARSHPKREVTDNGRRSFPREFTIAWTRKSKKQGAFVSAKKQEMRKHELSLSNPVGLFADAMDAAAALSLDATAAEFDVIFLDLCLYTHEDLVQSALDVLMVHHSARHALLDDLVGAQLLTDRHEQALYIDLGTCLGKLQSHAEKQELCGERALLLFLHACPVEDDGTWTAGQPVSTQWAISSSPLGELETDDDVACYEEVRPSWCGTYGLSGPRFTATE